MINGYRVNYQIRVPRVLLIDDEGKPLGEVDTSAAIQMAQEKGLDLVEVAPNNNPPVTKIIDFGKFKYELEKKQAKGKSKSRSGEIKEIQLGTKTDEHDFNTKIEHAKRFIEKGYKIRLTVKMTGRENIYSDRALSQMTRVKDTLGLEYEQAPTRLGTRFSAILTKK